MFVDRTSERDSDGEHGSAGWMDESRGGLFNLQDMQSQEGLRKALEDEIRMEGCLSLWSNGLSNVG